MSIWEWLNGTAIAEWRQPWVGNTTVTHRREWVAGELVFEHTYVTVNK